MANSVLSLEEKKGLRNRIRQLLVEDLNTANFLALPNFELYELEEICRELNASQNKWHYSVNHLGFRIKPKYTQLKLF